MNKKKLNKNDVIFGIVAIVFMQIAVFFGVIMLLGMIQFYAENFVIVHVSYQLECLCRVGIASFGLLIASAWYEVDKISARFIRKARKDLKENENK